MGLEEDILKIGKKLEKMISSGTSEHASALDLLNTLKKMPMKLDVLQKTRIGMTVNNFRKTSNNEEVISLSKSLIKSWKKLLPADNANPPSRNNSSASLSSKASDEDQETESKMADQGSEVKRSDSPVSESTNSTTRTREARASDTTDGIRIKCREMLAKALRVSEKPEGCDVDIDDLAGTIEDCIHKEFGNTEMKYKNRVRSRVSNLRDPKNPGLRGNVLNGHIEPSRIAVMTAEEMASEDLKTLRAKLTKEAIDDHQMATTSGTKTDLLKCGRCGKRNCTYNQVQTRSADEPMTTFVFCNECGHRWKFC